MSETEPTPAPVRPAPTADEPRLYAAVFESSNTALFFVDLDAKRAFACNQRAMELFEAADKAAFLAVAGPTLARHRFGLRKLREAFVTVRRGDSWRDEVEMVTQRGRGFWALVSASPLRGVSRPVGLVSVADIDERKQAEDALRESEAAFRAIFENSPNGIFLLDHEDRAVELRIVDCNERAAAMNGYGRGELLGKPIGLLGLARAGDLDLAALVAHLRRVGTLTGEAVHRRKDGSTFWVEYSNTLVQLRGRTLVLGIDRDITERKRAEDERIRASKLESLGLLAGGIAHDFNNIFTAILGNLSLMRMDSATQPATIEFLDAAEQACFRAKELSSQLLTFAKGGSPVRRVGSLAELVRSTAQFCLRGTKTQLHLASAPDLRAVELDEAQFSQVVQNLLINAVQAMPEGGHLWIDLANVAVPSALGRHLPAQQWVQLRIRDDGPGIPREVLPRIFDPYFTTKAKGNGLGLATCYSIVRNHQGSIEVRSETGRGAEFIIHLPALDRRPENRTAEPVALPRGTGRILVMDDEEVIRSVCRRMLPALGYDVECVADGEAAIRMFEQARAGRRPFAAVLLDVTVPGGMGGERTIERLLVLDPTVRAIVMSGYAKSGVLGEPTAFGFRASLGKPFTAQQLAETLNTVLTAP